MYGKKQKELQITPLQHMRENADVGKKEQGSSAVSRTMGRPAEVLPEGSGI
jgi:hypothetical protein